MQARRFRYPSRLMLLLLALGLSISAAAGAAENRFVLRADLSGSSCPSELVLVEVTGCKITKMAQELVAELVAEGFDETGFNATTCKPSGGGKTEYICFYKIPEGCTVERTSITVEVGDKCVVDAGVAGRDFGASLGFHFFTLDSQ